MQLGGGGIKLMLKLLVLNNISTNQLSIHTEDDNICFVLAAARSWTRILQL
jgi:hypothetical protein